MAMVLIGDNYMDMWHCLQTFLVLITGGGKCH